MVSEDHMTLDHKLLILDIDFGSHRTEVFSYNNSHFVCFYEYLYLLVLA